MSILTLPKNIEDVQDAPVLDADWYELRLSKEPAVLPNRVLKDFMKDQDISSAAEALEIAIEANYTNEDGKYPGTNWVLNMRFVHSDPAINGIGITTWLQVPNKGDENRININGQKMSDEKIGKIRQVVAAFHGLDVSQLTGSEVELEANMSATFFVKQEVDFRDATKLMNSVDTNVAPMPSAS